jgi:putative acetyltransferase
VDSIRTATLGDADLISCLIQRTVRVSNAADYEPKVIDRICGNFTLEQVIEKMATRDVFVVCTGGRIVGTISLGGTKLHSLFVEPLLQRQGIGVRLVDHIETHAVAKGIQTLNVSSSITARPFYLRLGYLEQQFEPRPNGSTYRMSKALT